MVGKIKICKEEGCQNAVTTKGYCRLHYLQHWKEIKAESRHKAAKRLNNYVEGICRKSPKGYVKEIKNELSGEAVEKRDIDDNYASSEIESILEDLGYNDDNQVDRLISRIKIDESY